MMIESSKTNLMGQSQKALAGETVLIEVQLRQQPPVLLKDLDRLNQQC